MSKQLQIQQNKKAGDTLSKEQKRFNGYVKKIKDLRVAIEQMQAADLYLRREGEARVAPAQKASMALNHRLIMALDNSPLRHELTAKQQEKLGAILLEEAQALLDTITYAEDAELQAIFEKYNDNNQSYADMKAEEDADMKSMASQMLNGMFGMDIEEEDLNNPEKMREKILERQAQMEAEFAADVERRANRKKTPAQLTAEAKRKAAEQAIKKTAKQIYVDLAKNFHPDREPDETKRLEKTEIMKQITAAYDADDHLKLLELQMNLLSRDNVFADYNDSQLKYFNDVLKQQVWDLQNELEMNEPAANDNPYAMFYAPTERFMAVNMDRYIRDQKQFQKHLQSYLELIKTVKGLKEYVKGYELTEDEADFMDLALLQQMFTNRKHR